MDFGNILDQWDKETAKPYGKKKIDADRKKNKAASDDGAEMSSESGGLAPKAVKSQPMANPMDVWIRRYGTQDKDTAKANEEAAETPAEKRRRLCAKKCEAVIDLHGLTREEAWTRLESFFVDCRRKGLEKILIIHGKGTHSVENPVLRQMVNAFLEQNAHAGESGVSSKDDGGSGSTWVILK